MIWKAKLSDSVTYAISRIEDVEPWYLVNKKSLVFNNKTNMMTTPVIAITMNEFDVIIDSDTGVWTGTLNVGIRVAKDNCCMDWTNIDESGLVVNGYMGDSMSNSNNWTENNYDYCYQSHRLYCFEQ